MTTNKEKFLNLVTGEDTKALSDLEWRLANKKWLRESKRIAFKVLARLDELNWSQKDLAERMGVSPQQVNKIVRGNQNLTLDTITKLQEVLSIKILSDYKESSSNPNLFQISYEGISENLKSVWFSPSVANNPILVKEPGIEEPILFQLELIHKNRIERLRSMVNRSILEINYMIDMNHSENQYVVQIDDSDSTLV